MRDFNKPILNKKGEPLRILLAAAHSCIRVHKRARSLRKLGYITHGIGNMLAYATDEMETYTTWKNVDQFKNAVRLYINQGIDVIDYSNEPDFPVELIRAVLRDMNREDIPLVVDLHDLDSIRKGYIPLDERKMFNAADGLIFVSNPIQKITNELHKTTIPNIVLYSYCNKGIVEYDESKIAERHSLVYEGGANPPQDKYLNEQFSYRNLYGIIKRLVEMGNEVHVFCGNLSAYDSHQGTGARLYPPTPYDEMMKGLTKFKYGILIFNNEDGKKEQVNLTLTNKMFEYAIAGLPILSCWCPESMKYIKKHNIGFTFKHIEEIGDLSQITDEMYLEKVQNIKKFNDKIFMENFIWRLENLYAKLLGVEGKAVPDKIKQLSYLEYGKEETDKLLETK